ncbi:UDP-N-acetylmuramoyl-L-alanyl-D-glutamate--2,6-diaminopimelate ligase [Rhodococcus spongiicola]|uniref:UDP-N-acetylmuramoyl-L-alanyl-D-glutamate--2,6-diaminopimelate ligase n=1 Tax=Rhodococcus spongiicola TaxID=2487352 RepID=A0A438AP22_9NOCA|nr:UDP-N-acetylmuramoyl-L-alanyl-D-glutamate--2,6-diaminopimelate ligase [Rhodococcus spongiicola]RVW00352.1 UDP-N-acetylmuramoyl-L-alanyl-D-glutamate--2,6-diaminopimelate ligase [Rhodococcus spongiicola]
MLPSPQPSTPGAAPESGLRPSNPPQTDLVDLVAGIDARLEWVGPERPHEDARITVTGVELRAQAVRSGDLFAALPGAHTHGAHFVVTALEAGAVAVFTDNAGLAAVGECLVDAGSSMSVPVLVHPDPRGVLGEVSATIYGRPSERMQVIGITGTSGKTTSSYLIEAGLAAAGRSTGLVGTIETRVVGRRVPSALTTPEAPQLHALFAAMHERGIDTVVMEVSSHALALGRVDGIRFSIGAFTNLSQDHLDFHKDFDDYFATKGRLFAADSTVRADRAVICVDDEWGVRMSDIARRAHPDQADAVATIGTCPDVQRERDEPPDWIAGPSHTTKSGRQVFALTGPDGATREVSLRLPGQYNVANAALAAAVCATAGVDVDVALAGIADVDVPGRVQRVDRGQDFLAVVDYAHKPAALEAVIATLRGQASGRIVVVVGAGGDRDTGKRALMGEAGARGADLLVITDDNPRTEDPATIRAALAAGARAVPSAERGEVREIGDRAEAIGVAVRWARPGDVVLVAGKGHEAGQEINGVKYPFDDCEVLGEAIDRIASGGGPAHGGNA